MLHILLPAKTILELRLSLKSNFFLAQMSGILFYLPEIMVHAIYVVISQKKYRIHG